MKSVILAFLFLSSLAQATSKDEVAEHIARRVILQDYVDLAARAKDLQSVVATLSSDKSQVNMEKAQQAWRDARIPWETSEAFLFGPVSALGLDPSIDTWPVNKVDLKAVLNSGRTLSLEFVRNLGANLQGFHTIEFLLFGDGSSAQKKTADELTARELEYLASTAALLAEKTEQLAYAWSTNANPDDPNVPGFVEIIGRPGSGNPSYPTAQAVLSEYVKGIVKILDEVANGKIAGPAGSDVGSADPALVESPFAWNSLADFSNNIRSALYVYTGDYRATPGPGLIDIVSSVDANLAKQVESELRLAIRKIANIGGDKKLDFREAISNPESRAAIQSAIDHLNSLSLTFTNQVLPIVEQ